MAKELEKDVKKLQTGEILSSIILVFLIFGVLMLWYSSAIRLDNLEDRNEVLSNWIENIENRQIDFEDSLDYECIEETEVITIWILGNNLSLESFPKKLWNETSIIDYLISRNIQYDTSNFNHEKICTKRNVIKED